MESTHINVVFYGNTCVGIHKDDMVFYINGNNARDYASQGQQRTICLSLKMAEVELIKEKTGAYPVLLLDDVLSEQKQTGLYTEKHK